MKLMFLQANNAWAFMFGDDPMRATVEPMGNHGRFFQTRDEAVAAALSQGLSVLPDGTVQGINGESGIPPWEKQDIPTTWTMKPEEATAMLPPDMPGREKQGSILDPIHSTLDPRVFEDPAAPEPKLHPHLHQWLIDKVFEILTRHGYDHPEKWLTLVLTGSLTTYQYSDASDVDISLFVDTKKFPDWSRAEMISLMVKECDGENLPGTPHPLQCYVVGAGITPKDLYKPGLRSGYVVFGQGQGRWLVPPERDRVHDVEQEMNDAYTVGLLACDKMDLLLRFEPDQAIEYWHQLHKARQKDETEGNGDYATSNIVFKMLVNRGLAAQAATLAGDSYIPA